MKACKHCKNYRVVFSSFGQTDHLTIGYVLYSVYSKRKCSYLMSAAFTSRVIIFIDGTDLLNIKPFKFLLSKCLVFKCSRYLNVRYSYCYCIFSHAISLLFCDCIIFLIIINTTLFTLYKEISNSEHRYIDRVPYFHY